MKYIAIAYVLLSWIVMCYMADKIGELQTELKSVECPEVEPLYLDMNGELYEYVKEK